MPILTLLNGRHEDWQGLGICKYALHDCRKNWSISAKAMEPDMVTEMIIETAKKGVKVTGIVGDDNTTTAARLKTNVPHMNKQNPVGISRGMDAVVGHVFGDHSFCDDTWCRPLTNPSLKAALLDVFGAYKK
ncbi:hypothetical protein DPMN_109675 [Dreissena polymorpha]|uniref:Mutator-like transposase domain-containing protein n=1 Tax=Dreissena polymorpha TaxID=45954 RepID=A0A9D4KB63_DREPO|nr:hypothetical protein DPMN_109675 [Dreissena polymorpha]